MKRVKELLLLIVIVLIGSGAECQTIGSTSGIWCEPGLVTFSSAQDNQVIGFTMLPAGFALENAVTTCTFNAYFPMSGQLSLNGGALYLGRDLILNNPITINSTGYVGGNFCSIEFPPALDTLQLPLTRSVRSFNSITKYYSSAIVKSMDWTFNDKYVALGLFKAGCLPKIEVLQLGDFSLSVATELVMGEPINSVRWHPKMNVLAVGKYGTVRSESLQIYSFDDVGKKLTKVIADEVGLKEVNAVCWHPTGKWLATARKAPGAELGVYKFSSTPTVLSEIVSTGFPQHRQVSDDALSWDPTGTYLAVGVDRSPLFPQVLIYEFTGSNLILTTSAVVDTGVRSLDWSPTGSTLAVGLAGGACTSRLRTFQFDATKKVIMEKQGVTTTENKGVLSVHWAHDGQNVAIGRMQGFQEGEIQIFQVDGSGKLKLIDTDRTQRNVYAVRWSHDSTRLIAGDSFQRSSLYRLSDSFLFENARLSFHSDAQFLVPFIFQGTCSITNPGYSLFLADPTPFTIKQNSSLAVHGAQLFFTGDSQLFFQGAQGHLTLRNTFISAPGHLTATPGTIEFDGSNRMVGSFGFQARSTSRALLELGGTTTLTAQWLLSDGTSFNGHGNVLDLSLGGTLAIDAGAQVTLSNMVIKGVGGKGGIVFGNNTSQLTLSDVTFELDGNVSTTFGVINIQGPSTFIVKDKSVTVTGQARYTIDGVSLLIDGGGAAIPGNIIFAQPQSQYCSLVDSGTIRYVGNYAGQYVGGVTNISIVQQGGVVDMGPLTSLVIANSTAIASMNPRVNVHEQRLNTLDTGPGDIMMGGVPSLTYDLFVSLDHRLRFTSNCLLDGHGHTIHLAQSVPNTIILDPGISVTLTNLTLNNFTDKAMQVPSSSTIVFGQNVTLELVQDDDLGRTWTFDGDGMLRGNIHRLKLTGTGELYKTGGGTLTLQNLTLSGLKGANMQMADNHGAIKVQRGNLIFDNAFSFNCGALVFDQEVTLGGTGNFCYQSTMTSTINSQTAVMLESGFTFSYVPVSGNQNLLTFQDATSYLVLNNATLGVNAHGLQLLKGRMVVGHHGYLVCDPALTSTGLVVGDGTPGNNFTLEILPASQLEVVSGHLIYLNTD